MKKILILYSKAGGGHLSLAKAMEETLNQLRIKNQSFDSAQDRELRIKLCDPFPRIYGSAYKRFGANFQEIWGRNYHLTDRPEAARALHTLNYLIVGPRLVKLFEDEKPDLIISNYPFATSEVGKAVTEAFTRRPLKELRERVKIIIHLADPFSLHRLWFTYKEADLYLSATVECSRQAVENGIPFDRIKTVGWLAREEFRRVPPRQSSTLRTSTVSLVEPLGLEEQAGRYDQKSLRGSLGLNPTKFTLFLGGSGMGGGRIWEMVKQILNSELLTLNSQLIVVTGNNRQLLSKLVRLSEDFPGLFYLFPYVNNMPQLLSASDIVVGKAGPNLLFESIFMERPFLATGCLPGQEEGNLEFIRRENIGWVEEDLEKAVKLIEELSDGTDGRIKIEEKKANLRRIKAQHTDAHKLIAREIENLLLG